jgi:hypothetical protein
MSNATKGRTNRVTTHKLPARKAWVVKVAGSKIGIVNLRNDGLFWAVAGHERLGGFASKLAATNAVVEATQEALVKLERGDRS